MNWIDIIILCVIGLSALVSLLRGFVKEALSLISWICACFVASQFYYHIADYLTYFDNGYIRNIIAVIVLFITTMIVCSVVRYIICEIIHHAGLSTIDRILGTVFGVLRGILIVTAILFCCDTFTSLSQSLMWQNSILIPHFEYLIHWFFGVF